MTNTTNTVQIAPTTEIFGALMASNIDAGTEKQLTSDPQNYIYSHLNMDVSNINIKFAENDQNTVHLALPCYESLASVTTESIDDTNLNGVSGGEILISIGIAIGAALGATIATSVSVAASAGTVGAIVGGVIGGSVGAFGVAMAGGAIGTAVKSK